MRLTVNGEKVEIEGSVSVRQLLVSQKVATPEYVTVQLNEEFLNTADFDSTMIKEGDRVEFLYFMGGGQGRNEVQ
ncbi:bifunctional sulfur carrier protein/thiazole synthase protein [Peptococcaceae bacterium CEB3]|nr:bifunctional sulfur carrier protein/thiazole synthase protein [Peptococcaceae bacterium CEB3]